MEDLIEDRRLGPQEAGPFCDFLCMHGYPIYADFVESPTDERLLPFLGLITCWLGGREVLLRGVRRAGSPRRDAARPSSARVDTEYLARRGQRGDLYTARPR